MAPWHKVANLSWDSELDTGQGKDFLFLFDLLSHTSGIEATLRVLTHADETFRRICVPQVGEHWMVSFYWLLSSLKTTLTNCALKKIR